MSMSNTNKSGMVGKYVVVRCHDAGVHAGYLVSHEGRECHLRKSRRLWYWKVAGRGAFLSGIATKGLHKSSKVGTPTEVYLTEICEIILCTSEAEKSIQSLPDHQGTPE